MINKIKTCTILTIIFLSVNVHPQIAVNELHIVPDSGRSGYPVSIAFTINNTEQFVAFQFDVILPSELTFIEDSVWLFRKTDHTIIANQVNQETLRILAYSLTNQPFTGSEGEIVRIKFNLNGNAGSYNVGLNNVVITNSIGMNILTAYYPGFVKIISPDISGETNIDFGEVSVLDTISYDYQLSNTGNDTLIVTDFFSSETFFWSDTPLPQSIPPFDSMTFNLKFHNINKGQYSTTFTIRSNDPDEDPFYVDALASSFAPNYILIQDAEAYVGDTVTLKIDVNNYEQFIDFQIDLDFPESLAYVINSASLTNRKQDHIIFENLLSPTKIRLFTYSSNQLPFLGDTGTVATMNFVVGNDTGTFPLDLSGGILFDSNSKNIIRGTIDGEIYVKERPKFQLTVSVVDGWNMVSAPGTNPDGMEVVTWWPNLTGTVWGFNGVQYIAAADATTGEGYWMKNIGAEIYDYPAIDIVTHDPIPATTGWNMIGGYETSPLITALKAANSHITGTVWGFNGVQYIAATNLVPGYGYWAKTLSDCDIIIPDPPLSKGSGEVVEYFKDDWGKITITGNAGRSFTLYAVNGEVNLDDYELPPMPPAGMFDIRYGSGRIAEDINSSIQSIEMNGLEYPITVRVENMDIRLQDESGNNVNAQLIPGEEITINNSSINKLLIISGDVGAPIEYALEQNYPNPFNPNTIIKFSVPKEVQVKLSVFNILGEKVKELRNEMMKPL